VLLFLLNSEKVEAAFRNRIFANVLYAVILLIFLILGGNEIVGLF
jgi:hypothetical protein